MWPDLEEVEWDENKRAINLVKHGIDFHDAMRIWLGATATRRSDTRSEVRYLSVGLMDHRIIVVVWTTRGEVRRLISARMASTHERACYAAFIERSGQRPH
jgi:hypothetical protein